jgi:hypothetical protein
MTDILLNQKLSWPLTLLFWAFCIALWMKGITPILTVILLTMHVTELFCVGFEIGAANGCSRAKSASLCMLFGLFWWVPLKRAAKK